jgi:hypothetical protein
MKAVTIILLCAGAAGLSPVLAQDATAPASDAAIEAAAQVEDDAEDEFDPSTLTLEDIISCKIDVPRYNGFVFWFYDNKAAHKHYGLTPIKGGANPFLSEYRLAKPITVFGQTTNHIAFTNSGLLAVLSGVTPQQMAKQLDVRDGGDFMGKFLAERVVSAERIDDDEIDLHGVKRITMNVSTVSTHPDRVFVGCGYRFQFDKD